MNIDKLIATSSVLALISAAFAAGTPCDNPLSPTCQTVTWSGCSASHPVCTPSGPLTKDGGCVAPAPGGTGSAYECIEHNHALTCSTQGCVNIPGVDLWFCSPTYFNSYGLPVPFEQTFNLTKGVSDLTQPCNYGD